MTPARRQALRKARQASARKRHERARERKREWHRQHGYWFFHRWGLYTVPFTSTIKRLGESVSGFITLLALAERWLCPVAGSQLPVAGAAAGNGQLTSPATDNRQPPTGHRQPAIAAKVARALAQVLWLRPRVLRERARDRAIRFEARLRTVAELQGVLHGVEGPEAQARRTAERRQALSAETLTEYKQMRVLRMDPGDLWPRRLAWRIALRLRELLEDGFERERDLRAIRRRVGWLLELYQLAAEIEGGSAATHTDSASGVASPPPTAERRQTMAGPRLAEGIRGRRELEAIEQLGRRLKRVLAGEEDDAGLSLEQAGALLPALKERRRQARAQARKLEALRRVELSSAESLGNPFVSPGRVRSRLAGEVRRKRPAVSPAAAESPDEAEARWRQGLEELRLRDPESLERERQEAEERGLTVEALRRQRRAAESRHEPVGVRRYWDCVAGWCAEVRAGWGRYAVRISEMTGGREEWGWPVVRELELRAEVEARRRPRRPEASAVAAGDADRAPACEGHESNAPVAVILSGVPFAPVSSPQVGSGLREESCPAEGLRQGEIPRSARNDNVEFTYRELKRLLAEAFGVAPGWAIEWRYTPPNSPEVAALFDVAWPRRPAPRRVIERKLERVARLAWLVLAADRRRADEEAARLEQILGAARPAEFESTARALAALDAGDREAEFRADERLAHLSDALGRLLAAIYDRYREFGRLEADPVWFDAGRKRTMRQDLGLEPLPADFEPPEPPEEFVEHRRRFLARLETVCAERRDAWSGRSFWSDLPTET